MVIYFLITSQRFICKFVHYLRMKAAMSTLFNYSETKATISRFICNFVQLLRNEGLFANCSMLTWKRLEIISLLIPNLCISIQFHHLFGSTISGISESTFCASNLCQSISVHTSKISLNLPINKVKSQSKLTFPKVVLVVNLTRFIRPFNEFNQNHP